jgi:hypothetical protein
MREPEDCVADGGLVVVDPEVVRNRVGRHAHAVEELAVREARREVERERERHGRDRDRAREPHSPRVVEPAREREQRDPQEAQRQDPSCRDGEREIRARQQKRRSPRAGEEREERSNAGERGDLSERHSPDAS